MIIEDLKTYKDREIRIKTLEQERIVFAYDIERVKIIEQDLKEFRFKQFKLKNVCSLLTNKEEEIIYNIYMDNNYKFESLYRSSMDLNICYAALRGYRKSALEKLEGWDKGNSISIKI